MGDFSPAAAESVAAATGGGVAAGGVAVEAGAGADSSGEGGGTASTACAAGAVGGTGAGAGGIAAAGVAGAASTADAASGVRGLPLQVRRRPLWGAGYLQSTRCRRENGGNRQQGGKCRWERSHLPVSKRTREGSRDGTTRRRASRGNAWDHGEKMWLRLYVSILSHHASGRESMASIEGIVEVLPVEHRKTRGTQSYSGRSSLQRTFCTVSGGRNDVAEGVRMAGHSLGL